MPELDAFFDDLDLMGDGEVAPENPAPATAKPKAKAAQAEPNLGESDPYVQGLIDYYGSAPDPILPTWDKTALAQDVAPDDVRERVRFRRGLQQSNPYEGDVSVPTDAEVDTARFLSRTTMPAAIEGARDMMTDRALATPRAALEGADYVAHNMGNFAKNLTEYWKRPWGASSGWRPLPEDGE